MNKPRVLIAFDLEIIPDLGQAMKHWTDLSFRPGITMSANLSSIICCGYQKIILDDKGERIEKVQCINRWDDKDWREDINDDRRVCERIREVLVEADGLITHYGREGAFDKSFLNTRMEKHGLAPLPQIPEMDTQQVLRKKFKLHRNRLKTAAEFFGLTPKIDTGGWGLWDDLAKKKRVSDCRAMTRYCKQDVETLVELFLRLRPHFRNVPNANLFGEEGEKCRHCGSYNLALHDSKRRTSTGVKKQYQCRDCNGYSTSGKTIRKADLR